MYAEGFYKKFSIKVSGLKIGELVWELEIDNDNYTNDISLKSKGLLSAIYTFEGDYFSKGIITNNKLNPHSYKHVWKTNKTEKIMNLGFENNMLSSLNQIPYEKEKLRVEVYNIKQTKDPLSAFLEIIMGETRSSVVDGRRTYTMSAKVNKKENETVINIYDYSNLWADHKRNKFKKIIFKKEDGVLLPIKIVIHFNGKVFKLE